MHRIAALVMLVCVATRAYAQDQQVCISPTTSGVLLPELNGQAFASGYEKKLKNNAGLNPYSFVESGSQSYAAGNKVIFPREAMEVLRPTANYRHLVDYGTSQVLVMNYADAWAADACVVKNVSDYATQEDSVARMIGFDKMRHPMIGPFSVFFLNLTVNQLSDDAPHNDMATTKYYTCYWDPAQQLTVAIYYWYLIPSGMPSAAMVSYSIAGSPMKQVLYDFFNFQIVGGLGTYPFELPPFYMCPGWLHNKPALYLNKTLAFDSEVLMRGDNIADVNVILSFSDQMDIQFNVSKRSTTSGQIDGSAVTTTTVFDGTSGIRFEIDDRLGNCTMTVATPDNTDVLWAHLANPADFWQNKGSQAYGGIKSWRGLLCETMVNEVEDSQFRVKVRYEMYIAQNTEIIHLPMDQMPVAQLVGVPPNFQPRYTTHQNIFNYDVSTATIAQYDVSPCYVFERQRHFIMTFPPNELLVTYFPDIVRDAFIRAAASLTKISPVRVSMTHVESTDNLYITFTLLHITTLPGSLTQQHTSTAIHLLTEAVAAGNFRFTVRYPVDQQIDLVATNLQEITRRTPLNWFRGFSGGDLAAVMLCMFFGTMILATVIFYFLIAPYYKPVLGGGGTEVNIGGSGSAYND